MAEALAAGARVGFYEVTGRLGAGAMGAVYRARDTRLGRTVALKVLRVSDDPELLRRFDREARAASAVNHPNIVQIYDVGVSDGAPCVHYVVMEYVEGETLRRRLARGALPVAELLDLAAQLTDGLAKAHRAGIVHRDLRPENVMVTSDGLLKILDFGLAKVLPAPLADLEGQETLTRHDTQAGMLLGTLEYMSPEQASGRPVDSRTDQFSVGLILREMATGRAVFHRDTPAQVLAAVIERDPAPLREERSDAPPALEAVVARCLQKDPERRFARTDELASELAQLAGRTRSGSLAEPPAGAASAVSAEIVSPPLRSARADLPALYHVQTAFSRGRRDRGGLRVYDEDEIARLIHRGKLTGVELVRRDGEERWQPLYESQVFRREVPSVGDPRDAARWRVLRALGAHFTGFFIVGVVMYSTRGQLPFWMGIWGAVLGLQVVRVLPTVWPLLRRRPRSVPVTVGAPPALPAPGRAALPSSIGQEAVRVRALIERERGAIGAALSGARASLERASEARDWRLYQRQLDVLKLREDAIAKAVRVHERLRVRRDLAAQQLKQLRLDLSRGAAVGLDVPELSSRLQLIRHEVDAKEEVEEIDAATD